MPRLRFLLLLLLLGCGAALFLSPGCMTDPVTGKRSLGLINPSDDEEVREGRKYAASFVAEYDGAYPDRDAGDYLAAIVLRVGSLSHRPRLPYRFTLLNSSVPNAFALPGGEVFLTRGLLARLDEEAMFAVVMAHEVGHVNHRHAVKAMNDRLLVGLGGSLLAGAVQDERDREVASGLASVGGGLLLLRFSRDQELEADSRGVEYAYRAGYDPRRGARVFEEFARMKREAGGAGGPLDSWLSTHPLDEDRVAHIRSEVDARYPALRGDAAAADLAVNSARYGEVLASVRAAQARYEVLDRARSRAARALQAGDGGAARRALRDVEEAGAALPSHALFPAVEGAILHSLGDRREARARLQRAGRLQPDLFFARWRLALLEVEDGRPTEGLDAARAAAGLDPGHAGARLLVGRSLEALGRNPEAAAAYREATELAAPGSAEESDARARLRALAPAEEPAPPKGAPAKRKGGR